MLARALDMFSGRSDVVVLALPRGGVPVGREVARALSAPLDVICVRKLGTPGQEELAMGAIASGGVRVVDQDIRLARGVDLETLDRIARAESRELARREKAYRSGRAAIPVEDRTAILVDDGLATGASMRAAVRGVARRDPARTVVAVPVGSVEACTSLRSEADAVICLAQPEPFWAVGLWYDDFAQVADEEVTQILEAQSAWLSTQGGPDARPV